MVLMDLNCAACLSLQLPNRHIRSSASTNMTPKPKSFNTGREYPTIDSGIIGSSYGYQGSTVAAAAETPIDCDVFSPSNIAQRLAIRRQLIDSYFFSSI